MPSRQKLIQIIKNQHVSYTGFFPRKSCLDGKTSINRMVKCHAEKYQVYRVKKYLEGFFWGEDKF
jgi:hypothetical protein